MNAISEDEDGSLAPDSPLRALGKSSSGAPSGGKTASKRSKTKPMSRRSPPNEQRPAAVRQQHSPAAQEKRSTLMGSGRKYTKSYSIQDIFAD